MRTGAFVALLVLVFASTQALAEPALEVTGADGAPVQLVLRDGEAALIGRGTGEGRQLPRAARAWCRWPP